MAKVLSVKTRLKDLKLAKEALFAQRAGRDLYDFKGVKYKTDELMNVTRFSPVSSRPLTGLVPKVAETKRLAKIAAQPVVHKGKSNTITPAQEAKNKLIVDTLKGMNTKALQRMTIKEMEAHPKIGRNASSARKKILKQRLGEKAKDLQVGQPYKFYDPLTGDPVPTSKMGAHVASLNPKNLRKINALFKSIDAFTDKGVYAVSNLKDQIGRIIYYGKKKGVSEERVINHIIKQMDNSEWGKLISKRAKQNPDIARAIKLGYLKEGDRPQISHEIPVSKDWKKGALVENVFYGPERLNKATRTNIQPRIENYLDDIGEQTMAMDFPYGRMAARGGLVKGYSKGGSIKNLLDEAKNIGMMSRRKFLKGTGATALATALPKSAMKLAAPAVKKAALSFAPPWVNGMLTSLKKVKTWSPTLEHQLGNNASVMNIGSKKLKVFKDQDATITYFKVKTSDYKMADEDAVKKGHKTGDSWDDVELREEPDQTTITWKNKNYDHGNDQHVVIDKKNKETRFVDDNWHMEAGGEDIAYDDWIEYNISPKFINQSLSPHAKLGPGEKLGDDMVDYYSVNDMDNSYAEMFQSYVDSFSPAGNIFGSVERMLKKITKRDVLRKEKIWNDEQVRNLKEKNMMDWEEQFRGGKGIHGYSSGGLQRGHHQKGRQPKYNTEKLMDAIRQVESGGQSDPNLSRSSKGARGAYQIMPDTAADPGFYKYGARKWDNFENEYMDEKKSRDWAQSYLGALNSYFTQRYPNQDNWKKAITGYFWGPGNVNKSQRYEMNPFVGRENKLAINDSYYNKVMEYYNSFDRGGIARRPDAVPPTSGPDPYATLIDDSVSQIMNNPSEFMGAKFIQQFSKGGYVKRAAPAVLGKITNYSPKITMSEILKNVQKAKKLKSETKTTLKSMERKAEEPGAMFWGSREKIIGAPSEAMTGTQWLTYMKIGKHGILNPKGYPRIKDMELNDTSLAPWLSRMGNKTVSKESLVKQFDEMAPEMEVVSLGESTGTRIFDDMSRSLKKIDTQAIRNPAIKGFYDYLKSVMPQLKSSTTSNESKMIAKNIDEMVYNNFGVQNALEEGVPQRFPFEIKELLQSISTGLGKRTAGFKTYKRTPQHRGTQTMAGGDNYREFLFKYKPGSLRQTEPQYKYAHDFNLSDADRAGGIVHTRTTDRADQFGRRLLHIEEIQSDMHQKVNMAQRRLKKMHAEWELKGKTPEGEYAKMSTQKKKDYDELVSEGKYAPRGDLEEQITTANEQHLLLVKAKIDDLLSQKQTAAIKTRIARLNKERTKVRKIIEDEKKKMSAGDHSGIPQGPLSKTEDYNEFIMKYLLRVAREGGYDGISINTPAIKNLGISSTGRDYKGNLIAYGPMARGAMQKAAKKSGAKFMKTYIMDADKKVWDVPTIIFKENKVAQSIIDKGLPIYKRGGIVKK